MAAPKTLPNNASVEDFLSSVENVEWREDTRAVMAIMYP